MYNNRIIDATNEVNVLINNRINSEYSGQNYNPTSNKFNFRKIYDPVDGTKCKGENA